MFSLHWSSSSYEKCAEYTIEKIGNPKKEGFDIFESELVNQIGLKVIKKCLEYANLGSKTGSIIGLSACVADIVRKNPYKLAYAEAKKCGKFLA